MPKESYVIKENDLCELAIMSDPTMSIWILGLNFFSNYYTVFDQEDLKIGFAISRYAHPRVLEFHMNSSFYGDAIVSTIQL